MMGSRKTYMKVQSIATAAFALGALSLAVQSPALAQSVPNPAPTATPTVQIPSPLPPKLNLERYISAGYLVPPIVRNEFSAGYPGLRYQSTVLRGAAEFQILPGTAIMLKADLRHYGYPHYGTAGPALLCQGASRNPSCVPAIGSNGTSGTAVPSFAARETQYDLRAGLRVIEPRIYLGASYLQATNNYGYPRLYGYGAGLEKLPDTDQTFSLYGGLYYYPRVHGNYTAPTGPFTGTTYDLAYHVTRYDIGLTLKPSMYSPIFVDAGYLGDRSKGANNAPATISRSGPFVGLGITF